jgi:hypothetical protein
MTSRRQFIPPNKETRNTASKEQLAQELMSIDNPAADRMVGYFCCGSHIVRDFTVKSDFNDCTKVVSFHFYVKSRTLAEKKTQ